MDINKNEDQIVNNYCIVCCNLNANICFIPCGHVSICSNCLYSFPSINRNKCPICRTTGNIQKIIFSGFVSQVPLDNSNTSNIINPDTFTINRLSIINYNTNAQELNRCKCTIM
jgi:hypothetical protein